MKLFSCAHGTRFFALEAVFELDYCNWQHRPLQRSTHISHLVLNILKVNVKAGVMIIAIISMRKNGLQILYSVNESANPSGVQIHSIFVN